MLPANDGVKINTMVVRLCEESGPGEERRKTGAVGEWSSMCLKDGDAGMLGLEYPDEKNDY